MSGSTRIAGSMTPGEAAGIHIMGDSKIDIPMRAVAGAQTGYMPGSD